LKKGAPPGEAKTFVRWTIWLPGAAASVPNVPAIFKREWFAYGKIDCYGRFVQ
jgi:hypothetical protein